MKNLLEENQKTNTTGTAKSDILEMTMHQINRYTVTTENIVFRSSHRDEYGKNY